MLKKKVRIYVRQLEHGTTTKKNTNKAIIKKTKNQKSRIDHISATDLRSPQQSQPGAKKKKEKNNERRKMKTSEQP